MIQFITYVPTLTVLGLYLTCCNTWRQSSWCSACRVVRTDTWFQSFHTIWLMATELTGLKSCWLFCLEYHTRESVPETLETLFWGGQSWTRDISLRLPCSGDTVSMRYIVRKPMMDILHAF